MRDPNCGCCKYLAELEADRSDARIVYESDSVIALHSTKPFAQVHIFIMLKPHYATIFDLPEEEVELKTELLNAITASAQEVIAMKGAAKLEMYLGDFQNTKHVHCHVIYDPTID